MDNKKLEENNKVQSLREIYVANEDSELISNLKEKEIIKYIEEKLKEFEQDFQELCDEFTDRFNKNEWIKLSDNLCYISQIKSIIPDLDFQKCYSQRASYDFYLDDLEDISFFQDFVEQFKIKDETFRDFIIYSDEAEVFLKKNPYNKSNNRNKKVLCCNDEFDGLTCDIGRFFFLDDGSICDYGEEKNDDIITLTFPINRLKNHSEIDSTADILLYWLDNKIRPLEFRSSKTKSTYDLLRKLYRKDKNWFTVNDEGFLSFVLSDSISKYFYNEYSPKRQFTYFPKMKEKFESAELVADDDFIDKFIKKLLKSDTDRASFDNDDFSEEFITGMKSGHWDLWDYNDLIKSKCDAKHEKYTVVTLPNEKTFYKRNPYYVAKDLMTYTVAIDFGTKSTVICMKDKKGHIIPIKISKSKVNEQQHDPFENPSILEFRDLQKFINDYNSKEGRPSTKWTDLMVSHEAFNDMSARDFNSFMIELKSWCSKDGEDKVDKIYTIKDQEGEEHLFLPYLDLKDNDIDPIEIYAYYLGLYINKLSEGKIYSRYKMSFPINFKENIREKIISSFEKGIRKSLPTGFLNSKNNDVSIRLRKGLVEKGLSEPAAYALTAFEKYGIKDQILDEELDNFHYAVFDFGGGTTDFDFGIYSLNNGKDQNNFDCILTHFGEGGLKNLGGEKLVKYLAFELFKLNAEYLKEQGRDIKFTAYDGCEGPEKFGFEDYIKPDFTTAMENMHTVMERLRWIWEDPNNSNGDGDVSNILEENSWKFNLFNENTKHKEIISLSFTDSEGKFLPFQNWLAKKIKESINKFLNDLEVAFKNAEKELRKKDSKYCLKYVDTINIFLAGNSSKSILFNQLLSKYFGDDYVIDEASEMSLANCREGLKEEIEEILETVNDDKVKEIKKNFGNSELKFVIYPPLRTVEAKQFIKKHNPEYKEKEYDINNNLEPSGKTGVAYGLLISDRVKDVFLNPEGTDVLFQFYVGRNRRERFKPILKKGDPMFVWSEDSIAEIDDPTISNTIFYYTSDGEANSGKRRIQPGKQTEGNIAFSNVQIGDKIYIRPIDQNRIEWRIVKDAKELSSKDKVDEKCVRFLKED